MRTWNNDWETFIEIEAKREREAKQRELHERNGDWHGDSERQAKQKEKSDDLRRQWLGKEHLGGGVAETGGGES